MRVLALGDLHGRIDAAARVVDEHGDDPPDVIVLAGDIAPDIDSDGDPARAELHRALRQQTAGALVSVLAHLRCPIVAVPGNHDSPAFDGVSGIANVDILTGNEPLQLRGMLFAGIGGGPIAPYYNRHAWRDDDLAHTLAGISFETPAILISHTPPAHAALELAPHEEPFFASRAVAAFVHREQKRIRVCLSGHLHRRSGVFRIGETVVVSCGNVCPTRARAVMTPAHEQPAIHPDVEQRFVIDVDDDGVTVTHHRRCARTAKPLPALTTRVERTPAERLRA